MFDENISDLVEKGYLTYSPNPFIGYFTAYKLLNHTYQGMPVYPEIPVHSEDMRDRDTIEDIENGHIIVLNLRLMEDDSNSNCDEIIYKFSIIVADAISLVELRIAGWDRENPEYLASVKARDETFYIVQNFERILKRMIDTKYIKYQGRVAYKIELESEKF